jgi:hypothetical protein
MENSVQRAFDHGYSHIFITDAAYEDDPEGRGMPNGQVGAPPAPRTKKPDLWQGPPPYFEALIGEVARQIAKRAGAI